MTLSHFDHADQLDFLNHQRKHLCTDCGHSFLNVDLPSDGIDFYRRVIGGGTIVANTNGPIRELHILPHCGTELPDDLLAEIDRAHRPALARLVHENADIGTGAIYRALTERILRGNSEGVAVAGFHLSRLLLDANRAQPLYQLPAHPYVGSPELYADYHLRRGAQLREEALLPWLDAVNDLLREMGESGVAYHHHTYDIFSMTPRPNDRASYAKRPPFQLIWKRSTLTEPTEEPDDNDRGLAPIGDLRAIRDQITEYIEVKLGIADGAGEIDFPLLSPVIPFIGGRKGDPENTPAHIMYDLRKDILGTDERVQSWVADAPWRRSTPAMSHSNAAFAG